MGDVLLTASAPGKIILSGEHSVVFGYEALACAINLRTTVVLSRALTGQALEINLDDLNYSTSVPMAFEGGSDVHASAQQSPAVCASLKVVVHLARSTLSARTKAAGLRIAICSDVPLDAGLGSSAALSVALAGALCCYEEGSANFDRIFSLSLEAEAIFHGKTSGLDPFCALHGGYVAFKGGKFSLLGFVYRSLQPHHLTGSAHSPLLVINTKIHHTTRKMVLAVQERLSKDPESTASILKKISSVTTRVIDLLQSPGHAPADLGTLITENQQLLQELGVSTLEIDDICRVLREEYGLHCKLTGAGGGGCVIGFPNDSLDHSAVHRQLSRVLPGLEVVVSYTSNDGLKIEK